PPVDARVEPPPVDARVEPPIDAAPLEPDADDLPPDPNVNAGWIGGPCAADQDCDYPEEAGGFCFRGDEGYPRGMCSLDCARTCPDREGMPVTFCVGGLIAGNGACVQRCDYGAFVGGCRPGYHCETQGRYNEPGTTQSVCLPGEADPVDPPPDGTCQAQVAALGMQLEPAGGGSDSPATHPNLICTMNEPMFLYSPVNGVDYRYIESANPGRMYMGCALALALYRTGQLLQELDIVEVAHIGTYNCRVIAGTNTLSEHAHGEAIDFGAFFDRNGVEYNIVRHWEHNRSSNFQTEQGRILYEIAEQLYQRDIFSIVLTPNYNAAHDDHLHVDLSDGNLFSKAEGEGYFGPIPDEGCGGERHAP
ncbi:extensin family protein, partial [Myxococcota bacterium]|nr:extensin family protein [Myxococcota bacterium]